MDAEIRVKPDCRGMFAQDAGPDAMKSPGPGQRLGRIAAAHCPFGNPGDAAGKFGRRPAGKGHQEDPPRIGPVDQQMSDPVGQRVGLARPCPGDHQKRWGNIGAGHAKDDSGALLIVQFFKI